MKKSLFFILVLAIAALGFIPAESYTLSGKVTDDKGNPLAGVSIQIVGTSSATLTDANGNFNIKVTGKEKLQISYVGFENKTIKVKNQKSVNVTLVPSSAELQEVVVVGYATQRRAEYSGAAAQVSAPQINSSPVYFDQALQGRAAGLTITSNGQPGSSQKILLRGAASIQANTQFQGLYGSRSPDISYNTEGYDNIVENPFLKAKDNPLSTFSIDVDAASYSNVRRFLNGGQLPPAGAVRIEEMINYFTYDYPQPQKDEPFNVNLEVASCPWNTKHNLVLVGIQGRKIATDQLPPTNLVFLIDVSGSMQVENKLPLVQASMKLLTDQLRPQDKVAIVVYAGSAGLVLPSTSGDNKITIKSAIDQLQAGGSTAGGEGIKLAYKTAKEQFIKGGNNRVILCTDGDFNVGVSSDDGLIKLVEEERKSGVFLTVLGYGMGNYQDAKMQKLADKGNGNHAYIDNLDEAKKVLVKEAGGTLYTIAKDVKLQVEFNPSKVQGYRLIGYENRMLAKEDFDDDTKDAGELGSGHTVTALYEIIPVGVKSEELRGSDSLRYQAPIESFSESAFSDELMYVKMRFKKPDADSSQLIAFSIDDKSTSISKTSDNFKFAASVAQFGMLLRNSKFKGSSTFNDVEDLARRAVGKDTEGYRKEFLKLVAKAAEIQEGLDVKR